MREKKTSFFLVNSVEIREHAALQKLQSERLRDQYSIVRNTVNFHFIPTPFSDNESFLFKSAVLRKLDLLPFLHQCNLDPI